MVSFIALGAFGFVLFRFYFSDWILCESFSSSVVANILGFINWDFLFLATWMQAHSKRCTLRFLSFLAHSNSSRCLQFFAVFVLGFFSSQQFSFYFHLISLQLFIFYAQHSKLLLWHWRWHRLVLHCSCFAVSIISLIIGFNSCECEWKVSNYK